MCICMVCGVCVVCICCMCGECTHVIHVTGVALCVQCVFGTCTYVHVCDVCMHGAVYCGVSGVLQYVYVCVCGVLCVCVCVWYVPAPLSLRSPALAHRRDRPETQEAPSSPCPRHLLLRQCEPRLLEKEEDGPPQHKVLPAPTTAGGGVRLCQQIFLERESRCP